MSELKKRVIKIFVITSAAWVLLLTLFYFLLVSPKKSQLADLASQLENVSSFESIQSNKKAVEQKRLECEKRGDKIKNFVVDADGWINIMPYVSKIAQPQKVEMFSSRDNSSGSEYGHQSDKLDKTDIKKLDVSFKSSFYQFARFINELESGQPVVFIKEFEIQRSGEPDEKSEVQMDLEVMVTKNTEKFENLFAVISN